MDSIFNNSDDKALQRAFRLGDKIAHSILYQPYVGVLFGYSKKILPNEAAVKDVIQDLFIDIWQTKARLSDVGTPKF